MGNLTNSISIPLRVVEHHNMLKSYGHCILILAWVSFFVVVVDVVVIHVLDVVVVVALVPVVVVVVSHLLRQIEYYSLTVVGIDSYCSIVIHDDLLLIIKVYPMSMIAVLSMT